MPDEVKKKFSSCRDWINRHAKGLQWKRRKGIEKAAESGGMAGAFVGVRRQYY